MDRGRLLIILTFIFLSCQQDMQEFEAEPNIFAVMRVCSGFDEQYIFVDSTYSIDDSVFNPSDFDIGDLTISGFQGVRDARVIVYYAYDTCYFWEYFHYTTGMYRTHVPIFSKFEYTLEVCLPWGDTVTGKAFLPTPIDVYWPNENDTISISRELIDSNNVFWSSSENVTKYQVYLVYIEDFGSFKECMRITDYYNFTVDTSCAFFSENALIIPTDYENPFRLIIVGLTKEYEDYWDPRSYGRSNLSCTYGVFTGIAVADVSVYITE